MMSSDKNIPKKTAQKSKIVKINCWKLISQKVRLKKTLKWFGKETFWKVNFDLNQSLTAFYPKVFRVIFLIMSFFSRTISSLKAVKWLIFSFRSLSYTRLIWIETEQIVRNKIATNTLNVWLDIRKLVNRSD